MCFSVFMYQNRAALTENQSDKIHVWVDKLTGHSISMPAGASAWRRLFSFSRSDLLLHFLVWGTSGLLVMGVAIDGSFGPVGGWCWINPDAKTLRLSVFYGPLGVSLIVNSIMMILLGRHLARTPNFKRGLAVNKSLPVYVLFSVLIWSPGLIRRLIEALGYPDYAWLAALQALCSPGHGFVNCCVYSFSLGTFRRRMLNNHAVGLPAINSNPFLYVPPTHEPNPDARTKPTAGGGRTACHQPQQARSPDSTEEKRSGGDGNDDAKTGLLFASAAASSSISPASSRSSRVVMVRALEQQNQTAARVRTATLLSLLFSMVAMARALVPNTMKHVQPSFGPVPAHSSAFRFSDPPSCLVADCLLVDDALVAISARIDDARIGDGCFVCVVAYRESSVLLFILLAS